jgi:2-polyprenyl-6-methoxyphenol hydroxylase-like FAD-dependent oxidoreductase
LRSTVRKLAFGPDQTYLHRFNIMVAVCQLSGSVPGFQLDDGITLAEPGRAAWVLPLADHNPAVMFSYFSDDIDAEFRRPAITGLRAAFGPKEPGPLLEHLFDEFATAADPLFDSVEQVRMSRWHNGRVVLVGDAAWCATLYSGMGASCGLAGADLLGTVLDRYPDNVVRALTDWEASLRPYVRYFQRNGVDMRSFFVPANQFRVATRKVLIRSAHTPVLGALLGRLVQSGRASRLKDADIAAA